MSVATVLELPCNWRKLNCWVTSKNRDAFPTFKDFEASREPTVFCEKPAVFIRKNSVKVTEMREWITRRSGKNFQAYGRFDVRPFEIEYIGAAFRFQEINDAVLFKMFWA